jgi:hypothetical protein
LSAALGVASVGACVWLFRVEAERLVLPLLPFHGDCLDSVGGWADLARGDLPDPPERCPAPARGCEVAVRLAGDPTVGLPARIIARRHAVGAECPRQALPSDDLTLPPGIRRTLASERRDQAGEPWASEALALHGLWGDALIARAALGDPDALDLAADLVRLDSGAREGAVEVLGPQYGVGEAPPRWPGPARAPADVIAAGLIAAAGRPERGANAPPALELAPGVPAPADTLDRLTGSGDATHALLAEAAAVRRFVGADPERLEAALFSPASVGSPPGDVHGAFVAGGGSPGATALAAELVWAGTEAFWGDGRVTLRTSAEPGDVAWSLDGCTAPRRVGWTGAEGERVSALSLALAERVGAWLRVGDVERAREAEALLSAGRVAWAPRLFSGPSAPSAGPPWTVTPQRPSGRRSRSGVRPPVIAAPSAPVNAAPGAPDRRAIADAMVATRSADDLAVAAWAAWRAHDDELARLLLRDPPPGEWPRYAWRTVAQALGEPSEPAARPAGCAPALWAGPL